MSKIQHLRAAGLRVLSTMVIRFIWSFYMCCHSVQVYSRFSVVLKVGGFLIYRGFGGCI